MGEKYYVIGFVKLCLIMHWEYGLSTAILWLIVGNVTSSSSVSQIEKRIVVCSNSTLSLPHHSPACHLAQRTTEFFILPITYVQWPPFLRRTHLMLTLFITFFSPARTLVSSCSEVADAFSADQTDACARSGSVIRHTEGFCSSHQKRSHVEIITCLRAAFILSQRRLDRYVFLICSATPLYYANAHCNGFRAIDQI